MKPYPANPQTLGEHIKKRRCELGLVQQEVAVRLDVNPWTIINWERDRTEPPASYIPRIVDFLGYDPFPQAHSLGGRLLAKRRHLGMSRYLMAKQLGIDEGTLAKWEKGEREPTRDQIALVNSLLA